MTNDKYIREKQIEKFDLYWSKKLKKLPNTTTKTSHCFVEMRGIKYYFNKVQRESEKDYCIVCKKGVAKNNSVQETLSERKVYSKNEFREVFVDYDEYERELKSVLRDYNYDYEGRDVRQENHIAKLYRLQQEYSLAFLRYLGCDVGREKKMLKYTKDEIRKYVIEKKNTQNLTSRYFEFAYYKAKRLRRLLKHKISTVLLRPSEKRFTDYCKANGFIDFHDLILIPYYSLTLIEEFGQEVIEQIIKDIKSYIDVQVLYDTYVTSDDI